MADLALPPDAYTAGEWFQRERHAMFAREWLLFAASGQMPATGDFVNHGIGGWPIFVIRGEDGIARAFHNICRHQNMPVVEQAVGRCDVLRCRYHGWSYHIDGQFRDAPERVAPSGAPEAFGLKPVELIEHDGFCFVRLQPGDGALPIFDRPAGRYAGAVTTDIDANWKAVVETLLASAASRLVWPSALIAELKPGVSLVRQVVPRTFLRTRLLDLVFTADGEFGDELAAAQHDCASADSAAAEACQAQRASGGASEPAPAVSHFLSRVAAACTGETPG